MVSSLWDALSACATRWAVLSTSAVFCLSSVLMSSYLIRQHFRNFTRPEIQSKIIAIIYMVPIYSIDSFLGLLLPDLALYINMLRDCYEAYVLYMFLSLMLSYLGCDEDDSRVLVYLEGKLAGEEGISPFVSASPRLSRGRKFLRTCKFGTLQYCVIRPTTALAAILLDQLGLYNESELSSGNGYVYLVVLINFSVAYAFWVLANFYYALRELLLPYEPVGKFLCIKFVIFFAFWQSVVVAVLVKLQVIGRIGDYGPDEVALGLQDYLICLEMLAVSAAHLVVFSHEPFVASSGPHPSLPPLGGKHGVPVPGWREGIALEAGEGGGYQPPRVGESPQTCPQEARRRTQMDVRAFLQPRRPPPRLGLVKASWQGYRPVSVHDGGGEGGEGDGDRPTAEDILDKHFATRSAIRDFNEAMPVLVLPTPFTGQERRGRAVRPRATSEGLGPHEQVTRGRGGRPSLSLTHTHTHIPCK